MSKTLLELPILSGAVNVDNSDVMHIIDISTSLDKQLTTTTLGEYLMQESGIDLSVKSATPQIDLWNTGGGVDSKIWRLTNDATKLYGRTRNDADSSGENWLEVTRSGFTISDVKFPNGTFTISGAASFASTLSITADGNFLSNLGVGIAVPAVRLDVVKSLAGGRPGFAAVTVSVFQNNATTGTASNISIIAGNASNSNINFGDAADEDIGIIRYNHSDNSMRFIVNTSEAVRIDNSGNVGIGVTSPAGRLHITVGSGSGATAISGADDSILESDNIVGFSILTTDTKNCSIVFGSLSDSSGALLRWNFTSKKMSIGTTENTGNGFLVLTVGNETEALRIDKNGNVGIGSTSPTALLTLKRDDTDIANAGLRIDQNSTGDAFMQFSLATAKSYAVGIDNSDSDKFKIGYAAGLAGVADNTRLTIDNAGNVGIGTTAPTALLHLQVNASDVVNGQIKIEQNDAVGDAFIQIHIAGSTGFAIGIDNSDSDKFKISYAATTFPALTDNTRLTIDTDGNVGIGTSSPTALLSLRRNDTDAFFSGLKIEQNSTGDAFLQFQLTGNTGWALGIDNDDSNKFKIGYNASGTPVLATTTRLTIDGAGKVTITQDFEVLGNVVSDLTVNALLDVSGGDGINTDNKALKTKIVDIGNWNMDITGTFLVAHGLSNHKAIRSIAVQIFPDTDAGAPNNQYRLDSPNIGENGAGQYDSTVIILNRETGQFFDDPDFGNLAPSSNRGKVHIVYEA